MNAVLVIAHAPLATALREAALHVLADAAVDVVAVDVDAQASPEQTLQAAQQALVALGERDGVLVLADVLGATPCNVAARLRGHERMHLLCGVNLPMLLRALSYRHEPLEIMSQRAREGGVRGIDDVADETA